MSGPSTEDERADAHSSSDFDKSTIADAVVDMKHGADKEEVEEVEQEEESEEEEEEAEEEEEDEEAESGPSSAVHAFVEEEAHDGPSTDPTDALIPQSSAAPTVPSIPIDKLPVARPRPRAVKPLTDKDNIPQIVEDMTTILKKLGMGSYAARSVAVALFPCLGVHTKDRLRAIMKVVDDIKSAGSRYSDDQVSATLSTDMVSLQLEPIKLPEVAEQIQLLRSVQHFVGFGVTQNATPLPIDTKVLPTIHTMLVRSLGIETRNFTCVPVPIFVDHVLDNRVCSYLRITTTTTTPVSEDAWQDEKDGADADMLFPCQSFAVPVCSKPFFGSRFTGSQLVTVHLTRVLLTAATVRNLMYGEAIETLVVENCVLAEHVKPGPMRSLRSQHWDVTRVPPIDTGTGHNSTRCMADDICVELDFANFPLTEYLTLKCDRRSVISCGPNTGHGMVVSVSYTHASIFRVHNAFLLSLKDLTIAAPHADFYEDSRMQMQTPVAINLLHSFTGVKDVLTLTGAPMQNAASMVYMHRPSDLWYSHMHPHSVSMQSTRSALLAWYSSFASGSQQVPPNLAHSLMTPVMSASIVRKVQMLYTAMGRMGATIYCLCSSIMMQLRLATPGLPQAPMPVVNDSKVFSAVQSRSTIQQLKNVMRMTLTSPDSPCNPLWTASTAFDPASLRGDGTITDDLREAEFEVKKDVPSLQPRMPSIGKGCVCTGAARSIDHRVDRCMRPRISSVQSGVDGIPDQTVIVYKVTPELTETILNVRIPSSRIPSSGETRAMFQRTFYVPPRDPEVPTDELTPMPAFEEDGVTVASTVTVDISRARMRSVAHGAAYGMWRNNELHHFDPQDLGYIVVAPNMNLRLPVGSMEITMRHKQTSVNTYVDGTLANCRNTMVRARERSPMAQDAMKLYGEGRTLEEQEKVQSYCTVQ